MTPQDWNVWLRILRDFMLVTVGTFMLIYETLFVHPPNIDVLSVGGALLGVPMVVRLDLWASGNGNGKSSTKQPPDGEDDRWSHLP